MLHRLTVAKRSFKANPASYSPCRKEGSTILSLWKLSAKEPRSLHFKAPTTTVTHFRVSRDREHRGASSTFALFSQRRLKHSCFYYKVFRHPHSLVLTFLSFLTCTLTSTIHIHLFHLFGSSPANKTCL